MQLYAMQVPCVLSVRALRVGDRTGCVVVALEAASKLVGERFYLAEVDVGR